MLKVKTRRGWGWQCVNTYTHEITHPFESAIDAQTYADACNTGWSHEISIEKARVEFRDGRFYSKRK